MGYRPFTAAALNSLKVGTHLCIRTKDRDGLSHLFKDVDVVVKKALGGFNYVRDGEGDFFSGGTSKKDKTNTYYLEQDDWSWGLEFIVMSADGTTSTANTFVRHTQPIMLTQLPNGGWTIHDKYGGHMVIPNPVGAYTDMQCMLIGLQKLIETEVSEE